MDLKAALRRDEFSGLSDQETLDHGDETVVVGGSDDLWSYSGVALQFGDAAAEGLLQAIQGAGLTGAAQVYLIRGMQLSLAEVQDKLTAIGQAAPSLAGLCEALKEIGITHGTRWASLSVSQPTLEQIAVARAANEWEDTIQAFADRYSVVVGQMRDGTITSREQVDQAILNW